jgi:PAS domain S-box-containing protein
MAGRLPARSLADYFGRLSFGVSAVGLLAMLGLGLFAAVLVLESAVRASMQRELRLASDQLSSYLVTVERELKGLALNGLVVNSLVDLTGRSAYLPSLIQGHFLAEELGFQLRLIDVEGRVIESNARAYVTDDLFADFGQASSPELPYPSATPISAAGHVEVLPAQAGSAIFYMQQPVVLVAGGPPAGALELLVPMSSLAARLPVVAKSQFWRLSGAGFDVAAPAPMPSDDRAIRKGAWSEERVIDLPLLGAVGSERLATLTLIESVSPLGGILRRLLPVGIGVLAIGLLISWLLARRLGRMAAAPIVSLTESVGEITDRGLTGSEALPTMTERVPLEVYSLGQRFRQMLERLREAQETLEATVDQRTQSLLVAQQEVADRGQRMAEVLRLSPDGFVEISPQNEVGLANPAFEDMTGLTAEYVVGMTLETFIAALAKLEGLTEGTASAFSQVMNDTPGESFRLIRLAEPWGRMLAVATYRGEQGNRLLFMRDITREAEIDQMKADFLSTAAHELRTPLASIQGFADLLLRNRIADPQERVAAMETIHRHASAMTNLVNDLLALAREEARVGRDYIMQVRGLTPVLRRVAGDFRLPDDPRTMVLRLDDHLPPARFDADRIGQVVNNLLSNAHKYSPKGSAVELATLVRAGGGEESAWVGFRVKDYGIGMTEEEQTRLFERFFRAKPHGSVPGTGLGMALVQEIVRQHDGRIEVVSAPGKGTAVTVLLPQVRPDRPSLQDSPRAEAL